MVPKRRGGTFQYLAHSPAPVPAPASAPAQMRIFGSGVLYAPGPDSADMRSGKGFRTWAKPPSESKPWEGLGAIVEEGSTKRVLCDGIEDGGAAGKARRIPDTLDAWAARRGETSTLSTPGPAWRRESPILSTIGFERCRYFQHFAEKPARIPDTLDACAGKARRILDTFDA